MLLSDIVVWSDFSISLYDYNYCLMLFESFFLFLPSVQMFVFYVLVHENGKANLLMFYLFAVDN